MSTTSCPSCSARYRAIRYSDDPTSRPLAYRINHRPDCRALKERQDKARASRPVGAGTVDAPNPAHAHEDASTTGPHNSHFAVHALAAAAASQQQQGSRPTSAGNVDGNQPLSIHFDPKEAA
jgi:hypothetical protein